jgi:N-methylhydantoinase B
MSHIDPITLEVLKNAFYAIPREMKGIIMRTAYSTLLKEAGDFSCALFDHKGQMVSQGADVPIHLGPMPFCVVEALNAFKDEGIEEGDVLMVNDVYTGGNHLSDVTIITPIFYQSSLMGFAGNRAHWVDIGGSVAAGGSYAATEIYQEGLRIPPVKIFRKGSLNNDVWNIIQANTRIPSDRKGDLLSQRAGNYRAVIRILEYVEKYGVETILDVMQEVMNYSERIVRTDINNIPDGKYCFSDFLDGDGIKDNEEDKMIKLQVTITVEKDTMVFDFTGTDSQVRGAINAPYAVTFGSVYYVVKSVVSPEAWPNSGCWRPISIIAPKGSVVNCVEPAAVHFGNTELSNTLSDMMIGALSKAVPKKVTAASHGCACATYITGFDRRSGDPQGGGFGGRLGKDGLNGVRIHGGNTMCVSAEVTEVYYPIRILCHELLTDSGGPGKYRGGLGLKRSYLITHGESSVPQIKMGRMRVKPWGLFGGKAGTLGKIRVKRGKNEGFTIMPHKPPPFSLLQGGVIELNTPGSGGYGNPLERDMEMVRLDVVMGYVSLEKAAQDYGVVIDPKSLEISFNSTEMIRRDKSLIEAQKLK